MKAGTSGLYQHLSGGASRLAALLLPQICSIFSVVAPCHSGAALRNLLLIQLKQATSCKTIESTRRAWRARLRLLQNEIEAGRQALRACRRSGAAPPAAVGVETAMNIHIAELSPCDLCPLGDGPLSIT
jgi:hypothetical protein